MKAWMRAARGLSGCIVASLVVTATYAASQRGQDEKAVTANWLAFEGDGTAAHFTPLTQIDASNISNLELQWTASSGGSHASAIVVDGVMFIVGPGAVLKALDARTGRERWTGPLVNPRTRGFAYWSSRDGRDQRLFVTRDSGLYAVDARAGHVIESFGVAGRVDLRRGLDRPVDALSGVDAATPGVVYEEMIILGSATGEDYSAAPGDIRAFDVRTGRLVWQFRTVPRTGDFGADTWSSENPRARHGGANAWGGRITIDEQRGIAFAALGSATYDFWGGDRCGDNLFANSLVALDARSGRRLWHFQTVRHDLWDYDLSSSPVLVSVQRGHSVIDAVAVAGKTGFVYAFERESGAPLWTIEERPVPQGGAQDECVSPTQPFPTAPAPFARQSIEVSDLDLRHNNGERAELLRRFTGARNDGLFTPPSPDRETVMMPGSFGGANWGAVAGWPDRGRLYVVGRNLPGLIKLSKGVANATEALIAQGKPPFEVGRLIYAARCSGCHGSGRQGRAPSIPSLVSIGARISPKSLAAVVRSGRATMPGSPDLRGELLNGVIAFLLSDRDAEAGKYVAAASGDVDRWFSAYGLLDTARGDSLAAAPKSTLTAYDLNRGEIEWQVETSDSVAPSTTLVTASGLVFIGSTRGRQLLALDAATGRTLWVHPLRIGAYGVPGSYAVDGRQYIVVPTSPGYGDGRVPASWKPRALDFAGSAQHGASSGQIGGEYVVFALRSADKRTAVTPSRSNAR